MNTKKKGNLNERKTMRWLEERGFVCTRSGASLGAFDIIGVGARRSVLVQVKSNAWEGLKERKVIEDFECHPQHYVRCVFRWKDYARFPEIKVLYYDFNGTLLWYILEEEDDLNDWFNSNEDL